MRPGVIARPRLRIDLAGLSPCRASLRLRRLMVAVLHGAGFSAREIARGLSLPRSTVADDLASERARHAQLSGRPEIRTRPYGARPCGRSPRHIPD